MKIDFTNIFIRFSMIRPVLGFYTINLPEGQGSLNAEPR